MRLRYIAITSRWLLAFVVGYFVTTFLVSISYHRYDDHGIGNYYGATHGNFRSFTPDTYLKFDAESPKAFRFAPPTTYTYGSLELMVINESGMTMQGKLHVPKMEFVTETGTQIVTEDLLSRWLLGPEYSKHDDAETVAGLYTLLQSAGSGAFPRPRHHSYQIPPFLPPEEGRVEKREAGSFVHFSGGYRVPHLPVYWTVICLVGWAFHMANRVITIRCTRSRGPRGFWKQ